MSDNILRGNVSFVNHEKKYIIIEYEQSGKKKTVNASIDEKLQKKHTFHIGDTVSFTVGISTRGDRMVASNIQYLYNNALDVLINKAKTENNFTGYLKVIDDKYFVKEIDSYLFFPVPFSPWQIKPTEDQLNETVTFALDNLEKKEKITASLFTNRFIPEYYSAEQAFKRKTVLESEVYKISPHGIYLNIYGTKIQAKIPANTKNIPEELEVGDKLAVIIDFLSPSRIIVSPVL